MAAASCARRSGERFSFLFVFVAAPGFFASAVDAVDAEGLAPLRFAVARAADFLAAFNALADSASCSLRLNFASFCGPSRKRFSSSWIFFFKVWRRYRGFKRSVISSAVSLTSCLVASMLTWI